MAVPNVLLSQYRRAFVYVAPYWRGLLFVLVLGLLSTAVGLSQPYISRLLIDDALLRRNETALWQVAVLMVAVTVVGFILNILSSYQYVKLSTAILFEMRLSVFSHLQRLSPHYLTRNRLGDVVSRINNDIGEVQRICSDTLLSVLSNVLVLAGSVAVMSWLNWRLFLLSVVMLPFGILAVRHYQERLTSKTKTLRERSSDIGSFLIENLMGMRVIVAAGQEEREARRFRELNSSFVESLLGMQLLAFFSGALPGTLLALSTASVFLYGGHLVITNQLTIGGLVAFMAYHMRLLSPAQNLLGIYSAVITGGVSLGRIYEILDVPVEVQEHEGAVGLPRAEGNIALEEVGFRHVPDAPVLDAVSFEVPAGSLCVILGPSGAGKSTLADLVARFYDPQGGRIQLDGIDLRQLKLADVRRHIAVVEQTPHLFRASVRENIAYGKPEATMDEIRACARAAAIDDFVMSLPDGYETVLGERGSTISAGERQRLALARALLRDPAVLLLDEPTSALDSASESAVMSELMNTLRKRTTILITHRESLAKVADIVIELRGGRAIRAAAASAH